MFDLEGRSRSRFGTGLRIGRINVRADFFERSALLVSNNRLGGDIETRSARNPVCRPSRFSVCHLIGNEAIGCLSANVNSPLKFIGVP